MSDFTAVHYDPGIFGFVKAHRHIEGPALVMSSWEGEEQEWAAVYWVKRLHHEAYPIDPSVFAIQNKNTMKAVERTYDILMSYGPPIDAYMDPDPDLQRQRVYDWEDDNIFPGFKELTWPQCQTFFHKVWKEIGDGPEPSFSINRRLSRPVSFGGEVCFPHIWRHLYWRKPVLLHEITHELRFGDKHGPGFVSKYIDLCVKYLGMVREDLVESATRYRVSVLPVG